MALLEVWEALQGGLGRLDPGVSKAKAWVLLLGYNNPWNAPGWERGAGKLGRVLGVLVTAAGQEPRGAQVGKRPMAPGLGQPLVMRP